MDRTRLQIGTYCLSGNIRTEAHVPGDYICYDKYMYGSDPPSGGVTGADENMRIVADVCRRTGRDFWVVLEANSPFKDEVMHVKQLYHQAFTALAFGAVSINMTFPSSSTPICT